MFSQHLFKIKPVLKEPPWGGLSWGSTATYSKNLKVLAIPSCYKEIVHPNGVLEVYSDRFYVLLGAFIK